MPQMLRAQKAANFSTNSSQKPMPTSLLYDADRAASIINAMKIASIEAPTLSMTLGWRPMP